MKLRTRIAAGFTLLETVIATGIGALILGGILVSTVSFVRVFNSANEGFKAINDQERVLDYVSRDLRMAQTGTVSNNGTVLTLNIPDYLDTTTNPPAPRTPTVATGAPSVTNGNGTVTYNSAGFTTVVYQMHAKNLQNVIRTETTPAGVSSTVTLSSDIEDFQFVNTDPTNANSTNFSFGGPGQPPGVRTSMTFARKSVPGLAKGNTRGGTMASSLTSARNHK